MQCLKIRNAKYAALVFLLYGSTLLLTGCGPDIHMLNDMKNVEERDYATIMLIEEMQEDTNYHFVLGIAQEKVVGEKSMVEKVSEWEAKDLEALAKDYGNVMGKDLSLAHLKVILLGTETEHEQDFPLEQLLYLLKKEDEIAKTCPVLELPEYQEFIDFMEEEEEPVGNYLENLVRVKGKQGEDVPWLKDYLKALQENEEIQVMYLKKAKEGWEIVKEN